MPNFEKGMNKLLYDTTLHLLISIRDEFEPWFDDVWYVE
jgi:hypothetical protein